MIAHHSKKNLDPDSTAREDSWGSQFLNAFLEAGWQVRRNPRLPTNEVIVRRHSKVMGNQAPVALTFDISTVYPMKYKVSTRGYEPAAPGIRQPAQANILDIMNREKVALSQAQVCELTNRGRSTVSRQMRQLEAAGLISRMPDGKYEVVKIMEEDEQS